MKHLFALLSIMFLISCSEKQDIVDEPTNDLEKTTQLSDEELIKRQVESRLGIHGNEDYSLSVYEENLNGDEDLDKVITVNLLDRALKEAIESGNVVKRAEIGYMGNYNFLFFMDGKTKSITEPIAVPSSPHAKLKVQFENIRTEAYKDVLIDFRIRNSSFRRFYTMINNLPRQTFEMKIFDGLGTPETEAYFSKYETGSYSLAKDIVVYKGILEDMQFDDPMAIYSAEPIIKETEIVDRKWFYNDHERKYFTNK